MTSASGGQLDIFFIYPGMFSFLVMQWFFLINTKFISSHSRYSHPTAAVQARYVQAKLSVHDRSLKVATVIESLEMEMELLCLTGVEDQLQTDVRPTLEILRNAGIKVWGLYSCSSK